jgi:hypothetical protein
MPGWDDEALDVSVDVKHQIWHFLIYVHVPLSETCMDRSDIKGTELLWQSVTIVHTYLCLYIFAM